MKRRDLLIGGGAVAAAAALPSLPSAASPALARSPILKLFIKRAFPLVERSKISFAITNWLFKNGGEKPYEGGSFSIHKVANEVSIDELVEFLRTDDSIQEYRTSDYGGSQVDCLHTAFGSDDSGLNGLIITKALLDMGPPVTYYIYKRYEPTSGDVWTPVYMIDDETVRTVRFEDLPQFFRRVVVDYDNTKSV